MAISTQRQEPFLLLYIHYLHIHICTLHAYTSIYAYICVSLYIYKVEESLRTTYKVKDSLLTPVFSSLYSSKFQQCFTPTIKVSFYFTVEVLTFKTLTTVVVLIALTAKYH